MAREKCLKCNNWIEIGSWPYCPHPSTRSENATRFKPIVVFKRSDGTYSFPASSDAKTPDGYQRVEITTRRQAEKLEREVNRSLREEKARIGSTPLDAHSDKMYQLRRLARGERVTIPDHDEHGNLVMRVLDGSQMRGKFREYAERIAERESQPSYAPSYDPGFHIDIMHNDSSNRLGHDDERSGWRERRE